jgi:hypothetical protein
MSKRLIQRQQVIDCGTETCGKCRKRLDSWCRHFGVQLQYADMRGRTVLLRCVACKETETKKPMDIETRKHNGKTFPEFCREAIREFDGNAKTAKAKSRPNS